MKFFEHSTVFNYTWDQVAQGFWRRYPNPQSKHVLTEDTVQRNVKSGRLFTKRILSKTNAIPKWGERFFNARHVHIVEESIVDPENKILVTYTRNLGFTRVMSVTEKVIYTVSADHPGKTVVLRSAWIDSQVMGFGRAICAFGYERFKKNCTKMIGGFDYVLANLFPNQNPNNPLQTVHVSSTTASKLKEAAKNATQLAKSKASPIYARY